jgi:hypothetical protein
MFRMRLFLSAVCLALLSSASLPASAQVVSVTVAGTTNPISTPQGTVAKGKGITVGGTFLRSSTPTAVWSVSDAASKPVGNPRAATAAETTFLDATWGLSTNGVIAAGQFAFGLITKKDYEATLDKIVDFGKSVAPDAGGKGNFPLINKPQGTILSADTRLQSNNAIEEARAFPTQTQTAINPPSFQPNTLAMTKAGKAKVPYATAATILKDPEEINWTPSPSPYNSLEVSLAGLTLSAQSIPDGIGWAFNATEGSYINDDTDLDAPESSATALYNVEVSELSLNGEPPTYIVFAATNGYGEAIYDGQPVDDTALAADLMSDIIPGADGLITFNDNAVFTVNIPEGTTGETLLFPDDVSLGVAAIVPEPSIWAMMLLGFAGLGLVGYRGPPGVAAAG